jgi:ATP-dependent DNA helicase DinG
MPFLTEHLPVPFEWALLKGKSSYECLAQMAEVTPAEVPAIEELRQELEADTEHSGDFEHVATDLGDTAWKLATTTDDCPGRALCPFGEKCFSEIAKDTARKADVVITNTAMLMIDARLRQETGGNVSILGAYDAVIIDEAHELPEIAQGAMSEQLRPRSIEQTVGAADSFLHAHAPDDTVSGELVWDVKEASKTVFGYFTDMMMRAKETTLALQLGGIEPVVDEFITIYEGLKVLIDRITDIQVVEDYQRQRSRQLKVVTRLANMAERLHAFLTTEHNMVRWIEVETSRRGKKTTIVKWSPVDVGPFLNQVLWSKVPVVMVSATLAVGGKFEYISETLGLSAPATVDVGTPFDYSTQGRMFLPGRDKPHPTKDKVAWLSYAQSTTLELVRKAGGGALLLYTSRTAMEDAHRALGPMLRKSGLTTLMQGQASNKELAAQFSADTHSVLFALKSFFTGVDFQGEACRLVVIDKMPFPVPTDVMFAARSALVNARAGGRDVSFSRLSVPMMTLTLIQAAGRLIRSVTDRGVVAILDPRLTSETWGKKIAASLPPMPVTHSTEEVAEFFQLA